MGEEVEPRRNFIQENPWTYSELDILKPAIFKIAFQKTV